MKYPIESEEKRIINRITFGQSFTDFLDAFNVDRGLIFTIKNLFLSPGQLIRNYLGAGRHKVVNPFRLLILTTAMSLIVMHFSGFEEVFNEVEQGFNQGFEKTDEGYVNEIMFDWYNLLLWISIPIFALITLLLNWRSGYNYAENLVLHAFYFSGINLIFIPLMPLNLLIDNGWVFIISFILSTILYFYTLVSFYQKSNAWFIVKNVFGYLLAYVIYTIVMTIIIGILLLQVR